jgi:hypothetical protein
MVPLVGKVRYRLAGSLPLAIQLGGLNREVWHLVGSLKLISPHNNSGTPPQHLLQVGISRLHPRRKWYHHPLDGASSKPPQLPQMRAQQMGGVNHPLLKYNRPNPRNHQHNLVGISKGRVVGTSRVRVVGVSKVTIGIEVRGRVKAKARVRVGRGPPQVMGGAPPTRITVRRPRQRLQHKTVLGLWRPNRGAMAPLMEGQVATAAKALPRLTKDKSGLIFLNCPKNLYKEVGNQGYLWSHHPP